MAESALWIFRQFRPKIPGVVAVDRGEKNGQMLIFSEMALVETDQFSRVGFHPEIPHTHFHSLKADVFVR